MSRQVEVTGAVGNRQGPTNGDALVFHINVENDDTRIVPITALRPADSPRLAGEDLEHIRILAESDAVLPPILVHRTTMRVVDGMHRLGAALRRGQDTIAVKFFDGSVDEAFVLAVKANIKHGLPLSFADRQAAAIRIIASHPHWSDRAIAAATGLAARTVAAVRARAGGDAPAGGARIGRDGRVRPLDGAAGRRLASQVIAARPDASLREIAKVAGISPATARDVRERMQRGDDPLTVSQRAGGHRQPAGAVRLRGERGRDATDRLAARDRAAVLQNLKKDPSLRFAESGRAVLRWLFAHVIDREEWRELVPAIPPHSAYVVAALARGCANEWLEFARQLESGAGTRSRV